MAALAGWSAAVAGILLLRLAWRRRRTPLALLGGAVLAAGVPAWLLGGENAGDKAAALALLVPSLVVLPVLLWGAAWRGPARNRRNGKHAALPAPAAPDGRWRRGLLRFLCAGPLSGAAALGFGTLLALKLPAAEADRMVAGVLLVPLLWAMGGVWSTTGIRILPIAGSLAAFALLAFAAASW